MPRSGRPGCAKRASRCPRRTAPGRASASSCSSPGSSARRPSRTSCAPSRATRRRPTATRTTPRSRPSSTTSGRMPRSGAASPLATSRPSHRPSRRSHRPAGSAAPLPLPAEPAHPRDEQWHVSGQTGTLRASIFGVSDGLVSNLSLVMGVVGAAQSNEHHRAGRCGRPARGRLLHGRRRVDQHAEPARAVRAPDRAGARGAARDARAGGASSWPASTGARASPTPTPRRLAHHLMEDPEMALDTKVREELGLDPDQLGLALGRRHRVLRGLRRRCLRAPAALPAGQRHRRPSSARSASR